MGSIRGDSTRNVGTHSHFVSSRGVSQHVGLGHLLLEVDFNARTHSQHYDVCCYVPNRYARVPGPPGPLYTLICTFNPIVLPNLLDLSAVAVTSNAIARVAAGNVGFVTQPEAVHLGRQGSGGRPLGCSASAASWGLFQAHSQCFQAYQY